ncbi:hypothetical protein CWC48_14170 [Pseudomonas sp. S10E 269]|uniref:EAL domain-containing protein n=1 Tax=Pseudomonas TaxID=286 RepID=UPI000C2579C3|nr:hypothetical protein CWC49_24325 [Pseudomonas sp. S09F 262]PJK40240.1 hypothetical protein CWC48_14170 [Pseudomonas sp. S10E 269]
MIHEQPSEGDVHRGLALSQFIAYFQPHCALGSRAVIGAEVLARWQHPTRGLLLPEDFLAAIAAYYLLDEVTKQVFVQGTLLQANLCRLG